LDQKVLETFGCETYLNIHWECGILGQFLYLFATSCGLGACGMGCFLESRSSKDFSLDGSSFSTFYHLSVGFSGEQYYQPYDYSSEIFSTN
jgi:nitroreductase